MKSLIDCKIACTAKIVKNRASDALKQRLVSFGMIKGAIVTVVAYAPSKSTIDVKVGKMNIALRKEEAKLIEVTEV